MKGPSSYFPFPNWKSRQVSKGTTYLPRCQLPASSLVYSRRVRGRHCTSRSPGEEPPFLARGAWEGVKVLSIGKLMIGGAQGPGYRQSHPSDQKCLELLTAALTRPPEKLGAEGCLHCPFFASSSPAWDLVAGWETQTLGRPPPFHPSLSQCSRSL